MSSTGSKKIWLGAAAVGALLCFIYLKTRRPYSDADYRDCVARLKSLGDPKRHRQPSGSLTEGYMQQVHGVLQKVAEQKIYLPDKDREMYVLEQSKDKNS